MKKFTTVFIILLYGVTATGFAMNVRFCSANEASIKINATTDKCGPDNEKMKGCSDKKVDVKVKDTHQSEAYGKTTGIFNFELPGFSISDLIPAAHQVLLEKLFDKTPPPTPVSAPKAEPFIKNRNTRI